MNFISSSTKRLTQAIPALSLAIITTFAHAGEISLFENPTFGGRQVSLRSAAPNIGNVGFNDRTSSIVVRAGRWEVCSEDGFRGECAIFEPGQYASLDARFDNRVSSAREVAPAGANPVPVSVESASAVQLYGRPNFGGRSFELNQAADNFKGFGFNDRASSLVVHSGTWEFCSDAGYRGTCRTFGPGRYPTLGAGMTKALSSARPVMQQTAPAVVHGGGWSQPPQGQVIENAPIVLFASQRARGRSLAVAGNVPDMAPANFNNVAQSAVIERGYWEFCSDSYYRGACRVLGPGQYPKLDPALYQTISSVRMASRDMPINGRPNRNGGEIELFTAPNFVGNRFPLRQDSADFRVAGYNNMIGSIIVNGGQWELCVDANFGGSCTVFGPGRYSNLGGLTNQLSSVRRID